MSTITIKIDEKSKAGKALKALIDVLAGSNDKVVEIITNKSSYDKKFVDKVINSFNNDERIKIERKDLWDSI
jgi:uncharacterized protein YggU (UPF0235/DUF167 family)